jgi:hypothetical protein
MKEKLELLTNLIIFSIPTVNSYLTNYGQNADLWTFWKSEGMGCWLNVSAASRYPEAENNKIFLKIDRCLKIDNFKLEINKILLKIKIF